MVTYWLQFNTIRTSNILVTSQAEGGGFDPRGWHQNLLLMVSWCFTIKHFSSKLSLIWKRKKTTPKRTSSSVVPIKIHKVFFSFSTRILQESSTKVTICQLICLMSIHPRFSRLCPNRAIGDDPESSSSSPTGCSGPRPGRGGPGRFVHICTDQGPDTGRVLLIKTEQVFRACALIYASRALK